MPSLRSAAGPTLSPPASGPRLGRQVFTSRTDVCVCDTLFLVCFWRGCVWKAPSPVTSPGWGPPCRDRQQGEVRAALALPASLPADRPAPEPGDGRRGAAGRPAVLGGGRTPLCQRSVHCASSLHPCWGSSVFSNKLKNNNKHLLSVKCRLVIMGSHRGCDTVPRLQGTSDLGGRTGKPRTCDVSATRPGTWD